jgi:TolB-like protein/Tfp pilus assembly protein PilF
VRHRQFVSATKQAVFLSYASEDAAAALRICESLRGGAIEVWLDQSELRGGDAWDRQIRQQIHDCALFIPVVSVHSNARAEGYFRREWRLAVERTHDMADDAPFLLPVVIDDTLEATARVPDQFHSVQWTRLPSGATPPAFVERVQRLLSPDQSGARAFARPLVAAESMPARSNGASGEPTALRRSRSAAVLVAVAAIITIGYLVIDRFSGSPRGAISGHHQTAATQPATRGRSPVSDQSIAVLPFVNLSSDREQEYFSDGLSEELINLLAKVPELHVAARTSSFYFKGKQTLIGDIARALGVANVLEGSVRKSGKTVRVTAQLVRADNGYPIWSDTYDRPLDDIFRIQDDIAGSVVNGLRVSLLGRQLPRTARTTNTEAYTLFLQSQAIQYFGVSSLDYARARGYLQRAVKLDPAFAPAWASLAINLAVQYSLFGSVKFQEAHVQGHAAADQALKLDPSLAVAYQALGRLLYEVDWSWDAADIQIRKAISLEPGNAESYRLAAYVATTRGHFDEALRLLKISISLDPLESWSYIVAGYVTYRTGELAEAEAFYRKAIELNPTSAKFHYVLGSLLLVKGQPAAALVEMQRETDGGFRQCGLVLALDALGRKGEADQALALAERDLGNIKAYLIALIYATRNAPDQALAWLDRALRQRDGDLLYMKGDPMISNLLPDPRFQSFMQRMQHAG